MKIAQVTGSATGGIRAHLEQICELLEARGAEVTLLAPASVQMKVPGVHRVILQIGDRPRPSLLGAFGQLVKVIPSFDMVHAHGIRAGALCLLARQLSRGRAGKPIIVVTQHNHPWGSKKVRRFSQLLQRIVQRQAEQILAVSEELVQQNRIARTGRFPANSVQLARIVVPAAEGALRVPVEKPLAEPPQLLTVARLHQQKGIDLLCETARILVQRQVSFRWLIAGDGPLKDFLLEQQRKYQLPLVWLGYQREVPQLIAQADLVVQTSHTEGQPVFLQEALRAGAAIVATAVGGTGSVLGQGGVLVPDRGEHLAGAIQALLGADYLAEKYPAQAENGIEAAPSDLVSCRLAARKRSRSLWTQADLWAQLKQVYQL